MSTTPKRYTLPALRRYLAKQPAKTWNDGARHGPGNTHCILGHLEPLNGGFVYEEDAILRPFVGLTTPRLRSKNWALANVNNGLDPRYKQRSPRARVLAAIDDLIAGKVKKGAV